MIKKRYGRRSVEEALKKLLTVLFGLIYVNGELGDLAVLESDDDIALVIGRGEHEDDLLVLLEFEHASEEVSELARLGIGKFISLRFINIAKIGKEEAKR